MREQTKYNKVVNISEDGEITVLDYTFKHSDGFKGATGSNFYPVSEAEYKRSTTLKAIAEYLSDAMPADEVPNEYRYNDYDKEYKNPFKIWAKAIINAGEEDSVMFDVSYSFMWDEMREIAGLTDKQAFIFTCTGGGRCFNPNFQGNVNPELSEIIRQYESK